MKRPEVGSQAESPSSVSAFALLKTALRIAEQPELPEVVRELLTAAHKTLGCERVRFYRAHPAEAVLREEAMIAVSSSASW